MIFRLRNPLTGGEFNVSTVRRRDRFLRRGFLSADEEPMTVTKMTDVLSAKELYDANLATEAADSRPEKSYREVQAEAKALGISANQTREDLEKAIAAHEE